MIDQWIESWEGETFDTSIEKDGTTGSNVMDRTFTLETSTVGVTTLLARRYPGLPQDNSPHPQSLISRARSIRVRKTAPRLFTANVSYEASVIDPADPAVSPLFAPPVISARSTTQEVEIDFDVNGRPIATVNGEPIRGVMRTIPDVTITVKRNLARFDFGIIATYTSTVNSSTYLDCPPGTLRIADIQANPVSSEDFSYFEVMFEFQCRRGRGPVTDERAWWYRAPHVGFWVKDEDTEQLVLAKNAGQKVSQPVFIIAEGDNAGFRESDPTVGHFVEFQIFENKNFLELGLL